MAVYSSEAEINEFVGRLGPRPFFVLDIDGNAAIGYRVKEGSSLPLGEGDNPKNQAIPFGLSPDQIQALVADGTLSEDIFAANTMDVRLPPQIVELVNIFTEAKEPFRIGFLTSRSEADAKKILLESGVRDIDGATLIADSGAVLNIAGEKIMLRPLDGKEEAYLKGLHAVAEELQKWVNGIVQKHMGPLASFPQLQVEPKGIGSNIHWRGILEANGQVDGSPLDREIAALLRSRINMYENAADAPLEQNGAKVFKSVEGPATIELKVASVDKGIGLAKLIEKAAQQKNDPPTSFVFSGDDYSKGNGRPGTDYYAAARTPGLSRKFGIAGFNVLTLHPVGADINGTEPDMSHMVDTLGNDYPKPPVSVIVPTPRENADLVMAAYGHLLSGNIQLIIQTRLPSPLTLG